MNKEFFSEEKKGIMMINETKPLKEKSADTFMKQIIFLVFSCFLVFSVDISAQKLETFDIISFKSPKGWQKEVSPNLVQIGVEDAASGGTCLIMMFKPMPGTNDSKFNFESAWETFVKEIVSVSVKPQMQPSTSENGWTVESGLAQYETDGRKGVVLLVTLSGQSKMVNILILTNTDSFQQGIADFLESVNLPKVEADRAQPTGQTRPPDSLTKYTWKSHQNRKDGMGNNAGYSTNSYQFYSNGTYKFSNVTFQYFTPKFYMVDEEGTYQVSGNKISLKPGKSYYHVHQQEKTDPAVKSGNISLEAVQYSFEFTTVYDRLRLVLTPDTGRETKRDGVFNFYANGAMTKSYLYDAE